MSPIDYDAIKIEGDLPGYSGPAFDDAAKYRWARERLEAGERARAERELAEIDQELDIEEGQPIRADGPETVEERLLRLETERQREAQRALEGPVRLAPFPPGRGIYIQNREIRRREREDLKREEREDELGLPRLQAEHDKQVKRIDVARDTAIREAKEKCQRSEQAAREKATAELEQLGPRPTLEELAA